MFLLKAVLNILVRNASPRSGQQCSHPAGTVHKSRGNNVLHM